MDRKEEAHQCITAFNGVCDLYNKGKLDNNDEGAAMLKVYQDIAKEAKSTVVELHKANPCSATTQYLIFVAKILVRLSHLIHNRKVETATERHEHVNEVMQKYKVAAYLL